MKDEDHAAGSRPTISRRDFDRGALALPLAPEVPTRLFEALKARRDAVARGSRAAQRREA